MPTGLEIQRSRDGGSWRTAAPSPIRCKPMPKRVKKQSPERSKIVPYKAAAHAKFKRGILKGQTVTNLCRELNINANTGSRWLRDIRLDVAAAMRARGINEHTIIDKFVELTNATLHRYNPADCDFTEVPDRRVQLDANDKLAKLLDLYPAPKEQSVQAAIQVIVALNPMQPGVDPHKIIEVTE